MCKIKSVSFLMRYVIIYNENENENENIKKDHIDTT